MKAPAFQFYADDFIGGTVTMTHEERGLYILALCIQWGQGALEPDDIRRLAGGMATSSISKVEAKFAVCDDGKMRNGRLEFERQKQAEYRSKQSEKGKASAKARLNRGSTAVQPSGEPEGQPKVNSPSPSPSPSLSSVSDPVSVSEDPASNTRLQRRGIAASPPTADEIKALFANSGAPEAEAIKFFNYYGANGWQVGKNPMKSLPHAVGGWIARWREKAQINGANVATKKPYIPGRG